MSKMVIKRLEVIDNEGDVSAIDFGDKLTIISGPSSTGKTWIYKSLAFVLGLRGDPFTKPGYDRVELLLHIEGKELRLSRKFHSKTISIVTNETGKDFGVTEWEEGDMSSFISRILGIPEGFDVPTNEKGELKKWSWDIFSELFLLEQGWTTTKKPILLCKTRDVNNTYLRAMLIHALSGELFTDYKGPMSIAEAERVKYAKKVMDDEKVKLSSIIESLEEELAKYADVDVYAPAIGQLEAELRQIEVRIDDYLEQEKALNAECAKLNKAINGIKGQLERYAALRSQYESDLNRLNFAVVGEERLESHGEECRCPLCNAVMDIQPQGEIAEAARAEVERIILDMNDLDEAVRSLVSRLDALEEELDTNEDKIAALREARKSEMPRKKDINALLAEYQSYLETKAKLEAYKKVKETVGADIDVKAKIEPPKKFSVNEWLPKGFFSDIETRINTILKQSNYPWSTVIRFLPRTFDITVDGNTKDDSSFGYVAHFNSVVWLAFREYFAENAKTDPGFFFVDTPLLGLSDKNNNVENHDSIRQSFFKYISEHFTKDQLIVIENSDKEPLPEGIEKKDGVVVIQFTHSEVEGRYGFLNKMRETPRGE